jgi:hypothetical protein
MPTPLMTGVVRCDPVIRGPAVAPTWPTPTFNSAKVTCSWPGEMEAAQARLPTEAATPTIWYYLSAREVSEGVRSLRIAPWGEDV